MKTKSDDYVNAPAYAGDRALDYERARIAFQASEAHRRECADRLNRCWAALTNKERERFINEDGRRP